VSATGQKSRPARNRGLLWVGGVMAVLVLLGVCGVGGWTVYQKLTGAQTPPVAQSTPVGATATLATQASPTAAALATDAPTATPTETPASGYILFASGDFATGHPATGDYVEGSWDIFVADTNGNNRKLLMHTPQYLDGQFAPNGQWLWFEIEEAKTKTVYAANADGSEAHKIYTAPSSDIYLDNFEFSNDGWLVCFRINNDPNYDDSYILYNHRNGLIVDSQGYQVNGISSDNQWALLVKGYETSEGWYESDEWSLVSIETGQWMPLGRYSNANLTFFPDGQNLLFHSHTSLGIRDRYYIEPGYKIYQIATASWSTLDISGESWADLLPDNTHLLFEEENKFYLMNSQTGERSVYLPGYRDYDAMAGDLFSNYLQYPDADKIIVMASKGAEDEELPPDIYIANEDGSDPRLVTQDAQAFMFFVDEEHILLARGVWGDEESFSFPIMDLRSGQEYTTPCTIEWYSEISGFALSPDKIHVLCPEFSIDEEDEWGVDWDTYKLWVLNIDTMEWYELDLERPEGSMIAFPIFSSDGSKIVYGVAEVDYEAGKMISYATYVVDLDGSNVKLIGEQTVPLTPNYPYTLPDF